MKKLLIPFFLLTLILSACGGDGDSETETEAELPLELPGHTITGQIEGADGEQVMLIVFEDKKDVIVDSAIVINNEFTLNTTTKELRQYVLFIGSQEMPIILILDEETKNPTVKGTFPGIGRNYTISGSEESQYVREYMTFLEEFIDVEQSIYTQINTTNPEDSVSLQGYFDRLDSISFIQRDYAVEHIAGHPGSPASWLMLRELFPATGLKKFDTLDLAYFYDVADEMEDKYPYSEYPNLIRNDISSVEAQIEQMYHPELAPDIVMEDMNGKTIKLSDLRGQVVLLDFWASWCVPCRKENPNVVNVYNQYKDKGFTVFSVSLDDNRDNWLSAIEADNLIWPNHVSDLKGWQSAGAALYGVESIPATFLIDTEGKIIATDLRGPALERKLQEILG
ncbi:MAG: peroxiredoxin [Crocinitomix sp.]|jgi:peroxiredoxin